MYLIRGNHEVADINALFGFRLECIERMVESDGIWVWTRFNQLLNYLPLAAMIEKKIICIHGGIGRSITLVEQIEKLERPITMDVGSIILMDLLWSDPTENDSIEGLRSNARGPGLVTFGVFVGARLHVTGGVLRGGRSIEGEGSIAVLDTAKVKSHILEAKPSLQGCKFASKFANWADRSIPFVVSKYQLEKCKCRI